MAENTHLRLYQADGYHITLRGLLDEALRVGLISPTGSGKTKLIKAATASFLGTKWGKGVVIAVPQNHIGGPFSIDESFYVPAYEQYAARRVDFHGRWAKDKADLIQHLRHPGVRSPTLITSHKNLTDFDTDITAYLPQDLTGFVLALDEGHHTSLEVGVLGRVAEAWTARGGQVIIATATPFRTDGNELLLRPDDPRFFRSLSTHLQSEYAPSRMNIKMVRFESVAADDGHLLRFRDQSQAEEMVDRWFQEGRPKAIINLPMNGMAEAWVDPLMRAFGDRGVKIRDFFTEFPGVVRSQELQELLYREHERLAYDDSEVDVILSCQLFGEGSDWKFCSHVCTFGLSQSAGKTLQQAGRATRSKAGLLPYMKPENQGRFMGYDEASYICIIPVSQTEEQWTRYFSKHLVSAHLLGTYMADHETGQCYQSHLRDGLRNARGKGGGKKRSSTFTERQVVSLLAQSAEQSKLLQPDIFGICRVLETRGVDPTLPNVATYLREEAPERNEVEHLLAFAHWTMEHHPEVREDVLEALVNILPKPRKRTKKSPPRSMRSMEVDEALIDAFMEVASDFVGTTKGTKTYCTSWLGDDVEDLEELVRVRITDRWGRFYDEAMAFHLEHGDMELLDPIIPSHNELIKWVSAQRRANQKDRLTDEQKKKLAVIKLDLLVTDNDYCHEIIRRHVADPSWILVSDSSELGRAGRRIRQKPTKTQKEEIDNAVPWFIWSDSTATLASEVQKAQGSPDTLVRGTAAYEAYRKVHLRYRRGRYVGNQIAYIDMDLDDRFHEVFLAEWQSFVPTLESGGEPLGPGFHEWEQGVDLTKRIWDDHLLDFERDLLFNDSACGYNALLFLGLLPPDKSTRDLLMGRLLNREPSSRHNPRRFLGFWWHRILSEGQREDIRSQAWWCRDEQRL
jgi:hypothetical protein